MCRKFRGDPTTPLPAPTEAMGGRAVAVASSTQEPVCGAANAFAKYGRRCRAGRRALDRHFLDIVTTPTLANMGGRTSGGRGAAWLPAMRRGMRRLLLLEEREPMRP